LRKPIYLLALQSPLFVGGSLEVLKYLSEAG